MIRIFHTVFFALAVSCGAFSLSLADDAPPQVFFQTMEDLPLMPGLSEVPDGSIVFDKPDGRIADLYASSGTLAPRAITDFYGQALRQTGWMPAGPGRFSRGSEILTLEITEQDQGRLVHFRIFPRSGPGGI